MDCPSSFRRYPELEKKVRGVLRYRELLSLHTTFRLGGPAEVFIIPSCTEEVWEISDFAAKNNLPFYVIGMGSNLLIADEGLKGIVVKIAQPLDDIVFNENTVRVGAGVRCTQLIAQCIKQHRESFSFMAGIPGTLGGAVTMNAGTQGQSIGEVLCSAWLYDREQKKWEQFKQKDFNFTYRKSILQDSNRWILLQMELSIKKANSEEEIHQVRKKLLSRKLTQPLQHPNAGCIWKNPQGFSTGKLIEALGLKGLCIGKAMISAQHANFIVHHGKACAREVFELILEVEEQVKKKYGILLEREIKILGNF